MRHAFVLSVVMALAVELDASMERCYELASKREVVGCYYVMVDSVRCRMAIAYMVDPVSLWPSMIRQKSGALYKLYEKGMFPAMHYMFGNAGDWLTVIFEPEEGDTVVLWNAVWQLWFGDSSIASIDYVTERDFSELITPSDVLRIPSDGLMRVAKAPQPILWVRFGEGSFKPKGRCNNGFWFDPPDSVTVINHWRQ